MDKIRLNNAIAALNAGEVIAYPTEAVYGLGCDPDNTQAIRHLLDLKQRPASKGLIIIAATYEQLQPYLAPIDVALRQRALASWPGPVTWLIPAADNIEPSLVGEHKTIAVRVTAHPVAGELCRRFGKPIVSTSANLAGQSPLRSAEQVRDHFDKSQLAHIVEGEVDIKASPSEIRDLISNRVIRSSQ